MITWEKAEEIFNKIQGLAREKAITTILELVNGNDSEPDPSPLTPSSATPVYLKANKEKKRKKKPGRKKGHPGKSRKIPDHSGASPTRPSAITSSSKPALPRRRSKSLAKPSPVKFFLTGLTRFTEFILKIEFGISL